MRRARVAKSRGQEKGKAKMSKNLNRKRTNKNSDGDVEVGKCHKTWRLEDVVHRAQQVFEKIEGSLRPLCMVEDLNDNEVIELCNSHSRSQQHLIRRSCVMCDEVGTP